MRIFLVKVIVLLISSLVYSQITVNGDLSESQYITVATKQNTNAGFGPDINVSKIVYFPDVANNVLFIGVEGKLNTASSDGIGIWMNIAGTGAPTGASAGTSLAFSGGGHYMGGSGMTQPNFKADFEVDYMLAINPGGSITNCFVDAGSRVGTPAGVFLGNCGQSGTSQSYTTTGNVFASGHTITFAFNNSGTANRGFEISIPFAALGATAAMNIRLFAFVVSSTAFFSDVTVPGNRTGGNPGFNPDFGTFTGGPYNSSSYPLPVELSTFVASVIGNKVSLRWSTASELNNYGFEIQRSIKNSASSGDENWKTIGFVKGSGNSTILSNYSFVDQNPSIGKNFYRLKQIDFTGDFEYSNVIEVEFNNLNLSDFTLNQNYPNPFNPSTKITYYSPVSEYQTLKVYDFLGREIVTLVDEFRDAGYYEESFDISKLKDGSSISSGIYFYKLTIGSFSEVKKMILNK